MLKKIPQVLSHELMKTSLAMGHEDEIIIATSDKALYANNPLKKGVV